VEDAKRWIQQQDNSKSLTWAITQKNNEELVGAIGLMNYEKEYQHAEMGYWIGKPFWGEGIATEAAETVLNYGFDSLKLNRIHAHHFSRNSSSGRVLTKIGMRHEGTLRQHVVKWDKFEDIELYGILKSDFEGAMK
jgi:RimJ/RimL family protein N-acetyltransferase